MPKIGKGESAIAGVALLAVLFAAALPAAAQQEDWRESSSSGEQRAFIDASSIQRDGNVVRFWREVRSSRPTLVGDVSFDILGALTEVDCQARTARELEIYAKLGDTIVVRGQGDGIVEPVRPGSTADIDLRAACLNEWPH